MSLCINRLLVERLQLRQTCFFFFGANMVLEKARFRVQG